MQGAWTGALQLVTSATPPVTSATPPVTSAMPSVTSATPPVTSAMPSVTSATPPVTLRLAGRLPKPEELVARLLRRRTAAGEPAEARGGGASGNRAARGSPGPEGQLAEQTRLSNLCLSQVERGLHQPSVRVLQLISEALGVPGETLLACPWP
ncbi:MAG TPA: helix-turn-helix domain-containing protein [Candidatus Acidoferrales bacterium]|nr:helix-turn-helix domain-containing protein [Candidatus Acidoferrales bacterium]